MLCSFSAGEGGDCKRNLKKKDFKSFAFFSYLQISPIYWAVVALYLTQSLQKWRAENFFLSLSSSLSSILSSSPHPFVIHSSSFCHSFIIVNLRMTEQPTLMEAPTPSHIAEEWYLGASTFSFLIIGSLPIKVHGCMAWACGYAAWFHRFNVFGLTLMRLLMSTYLKGK